MVAPALKQRGEKNDRVESERRGERGREQEKKKVSLSQFWCRYEEFGSFEKLRNSRKFKKILTQHG